MRRLNITNITPSANPVVPSTFEVALDYTAIFHGKEWIDSSGNRSPFYTYDNDSGTLTPAPPDGTVILVATTFEVVENSKYAGRYTVFTKASPSSPDPSTYSSGPDSTTIRVNEIIPSGSGTELTTGVITNISTYLLATTGEGDLVVLENTDQVSRPIEFVGRFSTGWGEVFLQNLLRQTQSFAGDTPPANPFQGQLWYDTSNSLLKVRPSVVADWMDVGATGNFRHTQTVTGTSWTVTHNLNLQTPFIAMVQVFINDGGNVKMIMPLDITFDNANQLTVIFSETQTGYVLVRG